MINNWQLVCEPAYEYPYIGRKNWFIYKHWKVSNCGNLRFSIWALFIRVSDL